MTGGEVQIEVAHENAQNQRRLLQREGGADADAGTGAERQTSEPADRRTRIAEKAIRIEHVRLRPQRAWRWRT